MDNDLPRLLALAEAAGLDQWIVDPDLREDMEWNNHIVLAEAPHMRICFMAHSGGTDFKTDAARADFIAAANPSVVAALVREVMAWRNLNEAIPGGSLFDKAEIYQERRWSLDNARAATDAAIKETEE